ncbi:hypothetical protein A8E25_18635 [Burkholderia cenocepacia]|nr:hypothetical protein A8E17_24755 [Burkholderia cenocepacia]ONR67963.1 hypothetical protein A8E23_20785 [Burkholderia cenocepacia]ONR70986.1 hypothetical protein A8E18_17675 [Burkholderia cenocepacia]ONR74612.1 hypothetical protein A8E22_26660 [Burkholderia cenocepacia]ONR90714.1 hypothetical protein A8E20_36155 [Burkholderia cenocepacia]
MDAARLTTLMESRAVRRVLAIQNGVDTIRFRPARHRRETDRANGESDSLMSWRTSASYV